MEILNFLSPRRGPGGILTDVIEVHTPGQDQHKKNHPGDFPDSTFDCLFQEGLFLTNDSIKVLFHKLYCVCETNVSRKVLGTVTAKPEWFMVL